MVVFWAMYNIHKWGKLSRDLGATAWDTMEWHEIRVRKMKIQV